MTKEDDLARISGERDRRTITLVRSFAAGIDEVWSALTDPDELSAWFAVAHIEPRVGGRVSLRGSDGGWEMTGTVRVFEPPRVVEYDWVDARQTSIVRYELESEGSSRTRLVLTERTLTDESTERRCAGWHHNLERLEAVLAGGSLGPDEARWRLLRDTYRKLLS